MEVNEQIVEQYLKMKGWFYLTDISFKVPRNYSNIDLLAYNPKNKKYYDIEVKYRSAFTISGAKIENDDSINKFICQLTRNERKEKISEIIDNNDVIKVFITTRQLFGKSEDKNKKIEDYFVNSIMKKGYECQIWYFDDIIPEIFKNLKTSGRYNSELMQTIRLIKTYVKQKNYN